MKREYIGDIAVDSGQVLIGDPCYLRQWEANTFLPGRHEQPLYTYSYRGACSAASNTRMAGVLGGGLAIAASTAQGDGHFPVYAERNAAGEILRLIVEFDEEVPA